jgi:2-polyprenyl-6-methoxyphenol hydroxylase-like FAD-dependent oxidoreductase
MSKCVCVRSRSGEVPDYVVQFDYKLKSVSYPSRSEVEVEFENGITASGDILIGTDGGGSRVRRSLLGNLASPKPLPVYMVNFNARYRNPEHAVYIRSNLRHFVDHGVHPKGMFFLMTLQSVPDPRKPETWSFQITITWPPELSPNKHDPEPPHTLEDLRELTKDWHSPKREAIEWLRDSYVTVTDGFFGADGQHSTTADVQNPDPWHLVIPSDRISIWLPVPWDSRGGRVTLAGDAAHAMTFHRGQGLNNCIRDAKEVVSSLEKVVRGDLQLTNAIDDYEKAMIDRGTAEVKTSMEQTLKCHNWDTFQHSPVMKIGGSPIRAVENTEWMKILAEQAKVEGDS